MFFKILLNVSHFMFFTGVRNFSSSAKTSFKKSPVAAPSHTTPCTQPVLWFPSRCGQLLHHEQRFSSAQQLRRARRGRLPRWLGLRVVHMKVNDHQLLSDMDTIHSTHSSFYGWKRGIFLAFVYYCSLWAVNTGMSEEIYSFIFVVSFFLKME